MSLGSVLALIQTASELGLISALTVIALYLSYSMLNVCDLSTDGCFTLGATVGAVVTLSGHPFLALPAAMAAGIASGFITAFLQTKMGVNSLLAGIIVNTALYSINIAVMGNSSILNLNKTDTVFTKALDLLRNTPLMEQYKLIVALLAVIIIGVLLALFLRTKLGLAIRATATTRIWSAHLQSIPFSQQLWDFALQTRLRLFPVVCLLSRRSPLILISERVWLQLHLHHCLSVTFFSAERKFRFKLSEWFSVHLFSDLFILLLCASICRHSCLNSFHRSSLCLRFRFPISKQGSRS